MLNWFKSSWRKFFLISPATVEASKLTPRAVQVLAIARREAQGFKDDQTDSEHVLLGLMVLGTGVAFHVLMTKGLTAEKVRDEVRKSRRAGDAGKKPGDVPYTPRVRRVLLAAQEGARKLGHAFIGTEHLLLGLLGETGDEVARILKEFKVEPEAIKNKIITELTPGFVPPGDGDKPK